MLFLSFLAALFVTMVLIPLLMRVAPRLELIDAPNERKVHLGEIPRVGGIALFAGFLVPVLVWINLEPMVVGYLLGGAVLLAFGVWDDRRELDYRLKFGGQVAAIVVAMAVGGLKVTYLPFLGLDPVPDWFAWPFTLVAMLAITNAINLADGLDGLAGGTTLLTVFAIGLLAYLAGDTALVLISLALAGAILGFLRYNTHPAQLFMGDAGSQFLGYSVGLLTILLTQHSNTALSPALPLLLLGLPILDTALVMAQRLREGRSPFSPDKNHIHHKLLAIGFSHHEAVVVIYSLQAGLVAAAYLLRYQSDALITGVYLAVCLAIVAFMRWARVTGWRLHAPGRESEDSWLTGRIRWLRQDGRLAGWTRMASGLLLLVYLLAAGAMATAVDMDIGVLALVTLAVLLVLFPRRHGKPFSWLEKAAVFVACTVLVYVVETSGGLLDALRPVLWVVIALMAVAIAVTTRFAGHATYRFTPLDFLVVLFALVVPNLPVVARSEADVGFGITSMIVLFYTIELVFSDLDRHWDLLRLAFLASLAAVGLRVLL